MVILDGSSDDAIRLVRTTMTAAMLEEVMRRPVLAELLNGADRSAALCVDDRQVPDLELGRRADLITDTNLQAGSAAELVRCASPGRFKSLGLSYRWTGTSPRQPAPASKLLCLSSLARWRSLTCLGKASPSAQA